MLQRVNVLHVVSDDSREMPAYSDLMHDASLAVAQVQKALSSRLVLQALYHTHGGL